MSEEQINQPLETPKVEKLEEPKVEVKTEALKTEEVKTPEVKAEVLESKPEEPKVEEKKEQLEPKVEVKVEQVENLSEDIKKTKEELAIIKEAREEIVSLYTQNKELRASSEQLTKDKEQLSKDIENLKSENVKVKESLSKYEKEELELNAKKRIERLEKLVTKFKQLGQEKTVEQLSSKDDVVLTEFEMLVDAALNRVGETKEMPSTIVPTQAITKEALESNEVKKAKVVETKKKPETLQGDKMFAGILKSLASEQNKSDRKTRIF
jgi:outer membrane murein-binding lipoprotein Lpp